MGPPTTFLTTQNTQSDGNLYPVTESTNHLTTDLNNVNLKAEPYNGTDSICVGNG